MFDNLKRLFGLSKYTQQPKDQPPTNTSAQVNPIPRTKITDGLTIPTSATAPVKTVPRYACPFYGFFCAVNGGGLLDQKGNQCALLIESYSPCGMGRPDWAKCKLNDEKGDDLLQLFRDHYRVFPDEFHPEGQSSWEGIPFADWEKHVFGNIPRPLDRTS